MQTVGYKCVGRVGLYDKDETFAKLSKLGNPLEKLDKVIDFEMFRSELEANMLNHAKASKAGQKPYDVVLMFKIILLKRFYNLSDEQAEYQINDRLSFKEFLGLSAVHDSQVVEPLVGEEDKGQDFYADSAYVGPAVEKILRKNGIIPQIIERAFKGKLLTDKQIADNRVKSKIRCRCEHVFGFVTNSMNDFYIQSIGFQRTKAVIGLINLVYNMCRYEQIVRLDLLPIKKK